MVAKRKRTSAEEIARRPTRASARQTVVKETKNDTTLSSIGHSSPPLSVAKDEAGYFLMKAEPESRIEKGKDVKFSIDDLKDVGVEPWDGVRNAEASKTMRERMKKGDFAFFYHSNTKEPGIAGIASIYKEGYPDSSAWDSNHPYFDGKSDQSKPRWYRVDVKYVRHLDRFISLRELKESKLEALQNMQLLKRPQLSVQRVTLAEWNCILELEKRPAAKSQRETSEDEKSHVVSKDTQQDTKTTGIKSPDPQEVDQEIMAEIRNTHGGND